MRNEASMRDAAIQHEMRKKEIRFFQEQEIPPEVHPEVEKRYQELISDPNRFIDKGGAGSVYQVGSNICIKALERRSSEHAHLLDKGNSPQIEASIQRRLSHLSVDGVRTPYCYGYSLTEDVETPNVIVMERLDAVNLQWALNGAAPFPESFDPETFTDGLYEFLLKMHEQGIAHVDLYPRNVMIDNETGNARVIDFGRSVTTTALSPEAREKVEDADLARFDDIATRIFNIFES